MTRISDPFPDVAAKGVSNERPRAAVTKRVAV